MFFIRNPSRECLVNTLHDRGMKWSKTEFEHTIFGNISRSFKRNQSCGIRLLIRSKLPHRVSASTSIHRSKKKFPANKRDFSEKIGYVPSSGKSTQTSAQNERCKSIKIESNTKLKSDVKQTRETCLHAGVFLRSSLFPKNLRKERIFVRVLQIKFNVTALSRPTPYNGVMI